MVYYKNQFHDYLNDHKLLMFIIKRKHKPFFPNFEM
jgi:hypothetical protein